MVNKLMPLLQSTSVRLFVFIITVHFEPASVSFYLFLNTCSSLSPLYRVFSGLL